MQLGNPTRNYREIENLIKSPLDDKHMFSGKYELVRFIRRNMIDYNIFIRDEQI